MAKVHRKDTETSESLSAQLIVKPLKRPHRCKFLIYGIIHIILYGVLIFLLYGAYQLFGEQHSVLVARMDLYMDVDNSTHDGKLCFMDGRIHVYHHEVLSYMRIPTATYTIVNNYLMNQTAFPLCIQAGGMTSFADDVVESKLIKYGNTTYSIFVREILLDTAILDVQFGLDVYMTYNPRQSFIKRVLRFVRGGLLIHKSLKTQSSVKLAGETDFWRMGGIVTNGPSSENVILSFSNYSKSPLASQGIRT